jgi:hypothetical protein
MNTTEFDRWFQLAGRAFPELFSWVNNLPESDQTLTIWRQTLENTKFGYAKAAVDAMIRGELDKPKFGWSDMPTIVRQFGQKISKTWTAQKETERRRADRERDRWINDGTDETCIEMFERIEREKYDGPPKWKGVG